MQCSGSGRPSRPAAPQPPPRPLLVLLLLAVICVLGATPAPAPAPQPAPRALSDASAAAVDDKDAGARPSVGGRSASLSAPEPAVVSPGKESRGLFSPRMDYDEWTPLGRGDPLKNDPTYDYVPPVLERVHYWIEPSSRTPDPPALNAQSAEQSSSVRLPVRDVSASAVSAAAAAAAAALPAHPIGSTPLGEAQNGDTHNTAPAVADFDNPDAVNADSRHDTYDPFLKFVDGPKFTSARQQQIYSLHHHTHHHYHRPSLQAAPIPQRKPVLTISYYNAQAHQQQSNQNSKPMPTGEMHKYLSSKKPSTTSIDSTNAVHLKEIMQTQQQRPYTVLIPPPLQTPYTFGMLGERGTTEELSTSAPLQRVPGTSTLSSITVEEANLIFHSTMPEWEAGRTQLATIAQASNYVTWKPPTSLSGNKIKNSNAPSYYFENQVAITANDDNTQRERQTGFLHNLLQNEKVSSSQDYITTTTLTTTATNPEMTSTSSSLTTDPLFSHYKQPVEPLRGPMYLIIQGHSKVKTYGVKMNQNSFHGIPIQVSNEIQFPENEGNETIRFERNIKYVLTSDEKQRWLEEAEGSLTEQLSQTNYAPENENVNNVNSLSMAYSSPSNADISRNLKLNLTQKDEKKLEQLEKENKQKNQK